MQSLKALTIALAVAWCNASHAQTPSINSGQAYSSKPVRILVGFTPGAGVDIAIRLIAPKMTDMLGQQVVVENRPTSGEKFKAQGAEILSGSPQDTAAYIRAEVVKFGKVVKASGARAE